MGTRNFEDLFICALEGTIAPEEKLVLDRWLAESKDNRNEFDEFKSAWETSLKIGEMRQFDIDRARIRVKNNIPEFKKKINAINYFRKVAAILIFPLLLGSIYVIYKQSNKPEMKIYHEIAASYGTRHRINLPDGTIVWLNSGSKLKFPELFSAQKREVYLYGEAFFDVAKDASRPFYVNLGEISVKATGTSFNITAYPEETTYETTLLSGKVELVKKSNNNQEIIFCRMQPKQFAVFNKIKKNVEMIDESIEDTRVKGKSLKNNIVIKPVEPILPFAAGNNKHTSWIAGKLVFRNDPMENVIKRLGRWYNVDIRLQDTILYDFQYTATFVNETLGQVLDLLAMSAPIEYSISLRKAGEDNTYLKEVVTIRLKKYNKKR
jgi:transmembrane sensor